MAQKGAFRWQSVFPMADKMRRLAAILFCIVLLALVWVRSPVSAVNHDGRITLHSLSVAGLPSPGPGMVLERAWQLDSTDELFGGYSALLALEGGRYLAVSDRGRQLAFGDPSVGQLAGRMGWFATHETLDKRMSDAEAVTRDPASGTMWVSYEQTNRIVRVAADGAVSTIGPAAMADWPANSGPEAMVRLADGRFIVLAEHRSGWWSGSSPALMFPGDPLDTDRPVHFAFAAPDDYVPVDMTQLPDGRVLVLLRALLYRLPPRFSSALLLADPADITEGGLWHGQIVARINPPLPSDNYEGLAIVPGKDGAVTLWIISDDNVAVTQRTLLLKLTWTPPAPGKGKGAPPRGGTP